jgi:hypothetical protein
MTKEALFAATRTFIHAELMRRNFNVTESKSHISDFVNYFAEPQGSYLLLWYSLLFNVCAFLKNQNAIPESIKGDLPKVYEDMNDLRNVAFHIPPTFFDKRFDVLINPSAFSTVCKIHETLQVFFDSELSRYGAETTLTWIRSERK